MSLVYPGLAMILHVPESWLSMTEVQGCDAVDGYSKALLGGRSFIVD